MARWILIGLLLLFALSGALCVLPHRVDASGRVRLPRNGSDRTSVQLPGTMRAW